MADGQPVTPGKAGTTTTSTPRLKPPSGPQPTRTAASTPAGPSGNFDQGLNGAASGAADLDAKVALLRQRLLAGEDVSLGEVGDATVSTQDQWSDVGGVGGHGRALTSRRSVNDLLNDLTTFSDTEVQALQRKLYDAGYFPATYYNSPKDNPVEWGNRYDFATRRAYGLLLSDGLAYKDLPIEKILADRQDDFASTGKIANGQQVSREGLIGGGKLYQTVLDDPASLRATADDLGQKILGRKPTPEERDRYSQTILDLQKQEQDKANAADESNTRRNFDAQTAQADANLEGKAHRASPVPDGVPDGLVSAGNIDLKNRPVVKNDDGTISTVRSITVTDDNGHAVLIPTVVDGKVVSNDDAIAHWKQTGQNLGVFDSEGHADAYANDLHDAQARYYHQTSGGFEQLVQSVVGEESGGNPTAEGPMTNLGQATGKYQALDSTWNNYKGFARMKDAPVEVQDQWARDRLKMYYDKYGAAGAAVAWYAGEGVAQEYVKNPNDPKWTKPQTATVNGVKKEMPSIASYATKVAAGNVDTSTSVDAPDTYIDPSYVTTSKVDASADMAEQIRKDHPDEAAAHDIAGQYETFRSLIGATRGGN